MLSALERIIRPFGFDRREGDFELLETETGVPGFLGGWREKARGAKAEEESAISKSLDTNEAKLRRAFRADINHDFIFRRFRLGGEYDALAIYLNGMADAKQISDFILREGMRPNCMAGAGDDLAGFAVTNVFTMGEVNTRRRWQDLKTSILEGCTAVLIDGSGTAIIMDTRGYEHRSIDKPENEKSIRGPQEGFSENLRTNITLVRRMIRTDDLVAEIRGAGATNNINLAIVYREGVANRALIGEVKRRLASIDTRAIVSSGILEQLTEKHALSPFPQVLATERPDRAASLIMEGHVAVLLEGNPFANVMPVTLFSLMSSAEDSSLRRPQGTTVRIVRFAGAIVSILLPAYFLALALYHQGLLSTEVLSTVIASRKMVFEPIALELVFLLLVFQLIREAGMRVPGTIGQAIGIIGGLILGQAAVAANLASSVVLIVVALTGLGNFCIPDYSTQLAAAYFRMACVFAAWLGGLLGLSCAITVMVAWTASLKSYGVPFLSPSAPKTYSKRPMILRGRIREHQAASDFTNAAGAVR